MLPSFRYRYSNSPRLFSESACNATTLLMSPEADKEPNVQQPNLVNRNNPIE
jgi:hypothetical protein